MRDAFEAAENYLKNGWVPLPVHYVMPEGCSCRSGCAAAGKHPVGSWKDITRENALDHFREWYERHPATNIGIRTGSVSGIVVLDIDVKPGQGGAESIAELEDEHGLLPETLRAWTGSGGLHVFFQMSKTPVPSTTSVVGSGLDVRGEGGQVVAAPSIHKSGGRYEWDNWGTPLAEIPDWLLHLMTAGKKQEGAPPNNLEAFVRDRLKHHVAQIRDAKEGEGRNRLNAAAYEMGRYFRVISLEEVVTALRGAAETWEHPMEPERVEKTIQEGLRDGEAEGQAKAEIVITDDIVGMAEQAIEAIAQSTNIYRRGNMLVRIREMTNLPPLMEKPDAEIEELPNGSLVEEMSRHAQWLEIRRGKDGLIRKGVFPPQRVVDALSQRSDWPKIKPIGMIINSPMMRRDTTIIDQSGYDQTTGNFYIPNAVYESVPEHVTSANVIAAVADLDDVVCDYVFETPAHRASWFASVLAPLARHLINGPIPFFLIDSSTAGTGKTLLAHISSIIGTGKKPFTGAYSSNDEEMAKNITSWAMTGRRTVFLDNINAERGVVLGNAPLCTALTSTTWEGRVLGESRQWKGRFEAIWYGTGNNVPITTDMARRICHIRICPTRERPEERSGFKYDPLDLYVEENRTRLLRAALTILRGRYTAGVPETRLAPWGSYTDFTHVIRQALVMAGVGDPGDARGLLREVADIEADAQKAFVLGWGEIAKTTTGNPFGAITAKIVLQQLYPPTGQSQFPVMRDAVDELLRLKNNQMPSAMQLAGLLRRVRKKIFDNVYLDMISKKTNLVYWGLIRAQQLEIDRGVN